MDGRAGEWAGTDFVRTEEALAARLASRGAMGPVVILRAIDARRCPGQAGNRQMGRGGLVGDRRDRPAADADVAQRVIVEDGKGTCCSPRLPGNHNGAPQAPGQIDEPGAADKSLAA